MNRPDPNMIVQGGGMQEEDIAPQRRIGVGPYGPKRAFDPRRLDQWPDEMLAKVANSNHPMADAAKGEILRRFNMRAGVVSGVRSPKYGD